MSSVVTPSLTLFTGAGIARAVHDLDVNNSAGYDIIFFVQFNQAHIAIRNRLFMEL